MGRKRVTEIFPFLLPLRRRQRRFFFYRQMQRDGCRYSRSIAEAELPYIAYETTQGAINPDTGFDLQYQYNKLHNLKVAMKPLNHVIIVPGEVFSFWQLAKGADRTNPYKPGLGMVDQQIVPVHGGGLCFISELLYWMFLHSPLTVIEKHPHPVISLPANPYAEMPEGIDATIQEGWSDLKVRNDTPITYQLCFDFNDPDITARLCCDAPIQKRYEVFGSPSRYFKQNRDIIRTQEIYRQVIDIESGDCSQPELLYTSRARIAYTLPDTAIVETEAIAR